MKGQVYLIRKEFIISKEQVGGCVKDKMEKDIDLTKAIEIAREWIRKNRVINLHYHMFRIERASKIGFGDKWLVVCSFQEDFNKRVYYVFQISFKGVILKIGLGYLEGDTIKIKEQKIGWEDKE